MDDVVYWRERAAEARAVADQMRNPSSRLVMLDIANGYDDFAERAEERHAAEQLARRQP
jgi:hypothetical protein